MNETLKTINDRIFSNPIYFIFGLSWFLVHWRFFATMFLVSNESIVANYGVTKDIYLKHILYDASHWIISLVVISLPFIATAIILYWLQPKVLLKLLEKHTDYEMAKELMEIEAKNKLARARENRARNERNAINAEIEKSQADESQQERNFQRFRKTNEFHLFKSFVTDFYAGKAGEGKHYIPLIAKLDSFGAVNTPEQNPSYVTSFTDIGKYFIQRMDDEK